MILTTAQQIIVKAFVDADPVLSLLSPSPDNAFIIAEALQEEDIPEFKVWKTVMTPTEYNGAIVGTEVDALSVGSARIWEWATGFLKESINPSKLSVRQAVSDAFSGPQAVLTRAALTLAAQRNANVLEALLATGDGTGGSIATMVIVGSISYRQVVELMGW